MNAAISPIIILNPADDVGVARKAIAAGAPAGPEGLVAKVQIGRGHKIALHAIPKGKEVLKFGQVIGVASEPIEAGAHVHLHNLSMIESHHAYEFGGSPSRNCCQRPSGAPSWASTGGWVASAPATTSVLFHR